MKVLLLLASLLVSALSARAELVFQGILQVSGAVQFNLVDHDSTRSEWLSLGDEYHGWKITAFDASKELLTLQRAESQKLLHLQQSGLTDCDKEELVLGMQISKPELSEHDFFVRVAGNQRCFVDDRLIDYASLLKRLADKVTSDPECRLRLHVVGDQNATFAQRIMEDAQRIPVPHLSIIFSRTDPLTRTGKSKPAEPRQNP